MLLTGDGVHETVVLTLLTVLTMWDWPYWSSTCCLYFRCVPDPSWVTNNRSRAEVVDAMDAMDAMNAKNGRLQRIVSTVRCMRTVSS
jgi:hypothetical protein